MLIFQLGTFLFALRLAAATTDPYSRYLASVKANKPETSVSRFAKECGIDLARSPARFAVSVGGEYKVVGDLAAGLKMVESDFYTSVEVHSIKSTALIILWPNDDAQGINVRELLCYADDDLKKAEVIYWDIPLDPNFKGGLWGHFCRWDRGADGKLLITKQRFVDALERPMQKPKLGVEQERDLQWTPEFARRSSLNLPTSLFLVKVRQKHATQK